MTKNTASRNPRRIAGNILLILGCALLLFLAGRYGLSELRARKLRVELAQTPIAIAAIDTPEPTPVANWTSTATVTRDAPTATSTLAPLTQTAASTPSITPLPSLTFTLTPSPSPRPTQEPAGPPVRIVIQDLAIDAPVVEMGWRAVEGANGLQSEWVIPEVEAGHHLNSAMLGEAGNIVISGHNNIYGRVFESISYAWDRDQAQRVDDLSASSDALSGRRILLFDAQGMEYEYTITQFLLLKDTGISLAQRVENARFIRQTTTPQLTLITCWPPSSNTHRLIIIAQPEDHG